MALWGGRFTGGTDDAVFALSRSVEFDWRLAPYDLRSSRAHAKVLLKAGLLTEDQGVKIIGALKELSDEVLSGAFIPNASDEDVHSALERGLTEKLGELGGSLRAGRSRNDQVSTDLRLYAIDHLLMIEALVSDLQVALIAKADEYKDAPAPGFTHLQHAQPLLFGHELIKHAHALARDIDRIHDWFTRAAISPLGSGALAGSSLELDPQSSAKELGFHSSFENSIDAVSDRDFVAEALFLLAMVGSHLSRMGEEWCLWSSSEFGWAVIDDGFTTGSSIMPQKRNPDVAELARGKASRLIGNLTTVLTMLKGLPFAYNRDLQEDKEPLFDSIETLALVLPAFTGMVSTTKFNREVMAASAPTGFSLATEVADFLVRAGLPFANAHEAAGQCVHTCEAAGIQLHELSDTQFAAIHPLLTPEVRKVLTVEGAVASRLTYGGTALPNLVSQIANLHSQVDMNRMKIADKKRTFSGMMAQ